MKKKKSKEEHTFLTIEVTGFEASSEALLSFDIRYPRPMSARKDGPAFEFVTTLKIIGKSIYPPKRTGEDYELTIHGDVLSSPKVSDYQVKDDRWMPVYRSYRGQQIPVYKEPLGIGALERRRGTKIWESMLFVSPSLVSDMLSLINIRPLYVSVHEKKANRKRLIQTFAVRTERPSEDE